MPESAANTANSRETGVTVARRWTTPGVHPFDEVEWELRDAVIGDPAAPAFEQRGVEFPKSWSQNATNIVAQKYFRGRMGSPERESSVKQMIGRVASTIAGWGSDSGYFASEEDADAFEAELTHILLHQKAAFNSPVWFNVGFEEHPQCAACFLLSVEDTMESILDWNTKEGMIFRGGSGSGINLSKIRSSKEQLSKGGFASGPVSFMRGADAWAGTIKCLAEGSEVQTVRGVKRIEELAEGDQVLTRFGPRDVLAAHSNGVKPLVKVKTELGNDIVCTAEHRFLVRESTGDLVWREARSIAEDDYLVLDLGEAEFGELQHLIPVSPGHHNERELVMPQVLHPAFAQWLGWIFGDGNITERPGTKYVGVQIADADDDLEARYRELVERTFGFAAHLFANRRTDKSDASQSIRLCSSQLIRFLRANDLAKGRASELGVPDAIKSSPADVRAAFVSGLFEADGGMSNGYPQLSTVAERFAIEVHRLLLSLGIPSKVRRADDRSGAFGAKPLFTVRIVSLAGIARYQQFVGFISSRKRRALDAAVQRKTRSPYETDWALPHAEGELDRLWQGGDAKLRRALSPYCRYARPRTLSGLRATSLLNEHFTLSGTIVEEAASPYAYYTRATVEPAGTGPVHDITVDGAHEYLVHNTVTHNSGGKTRRAAKMVILDVDHPDIEDFIWCKAKEEKKAGALRNAGFDMSIDGEGFTSIQYQNANNTVRVSDEFMHAVEAGENWDLTARTTGEPLETVDARGLFRQIAEAAWACADPGIQYDTTIQRWHTCPNSGRISTSNPCSEYLHVDDSACNLASLNLMRFRHDDGTFAVDDFEHAIDVVFLAQEIVVTPASYPTEKIGENARAFRQIGMGYANLGAYLMADGLPYDSDEGRTVAAAITALMTGRAYRQSALIAASAIGPYDRYEENRDPHNNVMRLHRDAAYEIDGSSSRDVDLLDAACRAWDEAVQIGDDHGYRNAQSVVIAPTGTISFLMDCDTTGIEPDFSLVKFKELVGGGQMTIVNRTVPMALRTLGYSNSVIDQIEAYVNEKGTIVDAPGLRDDHLPVFDCAVGERSISPMGHVRMMAAVQPFTSGAISKTINMSADATVEDIEDVYAQGHKLGLKALAIYRDGSKTAQALRTDAQDTEEAEAPTAEPAPARRRMPRERESITHKFSIAGHEGYITAGKYEDGKLGEIFLTDIGKEGSTLRGMMNAFATAISLGLQYGVPLEVFVKKFSYMRFDPEGITTNPEIPFAKSMPDYIMRWLASRFVEDIDELEDLGILTAEVRARKEAQLAMFAEEGPAPSNGGGNGTSNGHSKGAESTQTIHQPGKTVAAAEAMTDTPPVVPAQMRGGDLGPACEQCGGMMQRTGSCYTCSSCGNNTGCG